MTHVICEPCIGTKEGSYVDVCPVSAIFYRDEVPEKWQSYIEKNLLIAG